jgi:hypothetical protein
MQLEESKMQRNTLGQILWPKTQPGDYFTVHRDLVRRFSSIVSQRGLRVYMVADSPEWTQYKILTPEQRINHSEKRIDWHKQPITEKNVPRKPNNGVIWSAIFDDNAPEIVRVDHSLAQKFVAKCPYYGYKARRVGIDGKGRVEIKITRIGKDEKPRAKDVVMRDLASLPWNWITVIHDSVCAKAKLTPLTEEQRAELMETW